jgi:hypothetical protein
MTEEGKMSDTTAHSTTAGATSRPELRIPRAAPVYDATGAKIGSVGDYSAQTDDITVETGSLLVKDLYVPASAIKRVDTAGMWLRLTSDELCDARYTRAPTVEKTKTAKQALDNMAPPPETTE